MIKPINRICKSKSMKFRCGVEKPLEEFVFHKTSKFNRGYQCKDCRKAYHKAYHQRPNPKAKRIAYQQSQEYKEKYKTYRQTPGFKAKQRAYDKRPKSQVRIKAYFHRPEIKVRMKIYFKSLDENHRKKHRGICRECNKDYGIGCNAKGHFCSNDCRELYFVGENSPTWRGGISFEPYGIEWTRKFRREIRERDNFECKICFKHQDELSRALHIHHIDHDKENSDPLNLISLCNSCHLKTHGRKVEEFFKIYFKKYLQILYQPLILIECKTTF